MDIELNLRLPGYHHDFRQEPSLVPFVAVKYLKKRRRIIWWVIDFVELSILYKMLIPSQWCDFNIFLNFVW